MEVRLPTCHFTPGRYAWQLENALRFSKPIPYVGHQGLFNVDDDLVTEAIERDVHA